MPLDTVLLWLGLGSAVMLLVRGAGGLWVAKALVLIAVAAAGVAVGPLWAGWVEGALWGVLVVAPTLLSHLANRLMLAQRFGAALPVNVALWLLHPDRVFAAQARLVRGLAWAARGRFGPAVAQLDRLARAPHTPPATALMARFSARWIEGRLESLLAEAPWDAAPDPATGPAFAMVGLSTLASLGRGPEVVRLYATHAALLRTPLARATRAWSGALASLFSATGRVAALERLQRGPMRAFAPAMNAYHGAVARLVACTEQEAARATLQALAAGPNRALALRAQRTLARPPGPVALDAAAEAVLAEAEADLAETLAAPRPQRALWHSPVTSGLIAANLAAFAAELALGGSESEAVLRRMGALAPSAMAEPAAWWRTGTALFLHLGWLHLGMNMFALAVLGGAVERSWGRWRMLAVYLVAGLGSMAGIVALVRAQWLEPEWVVGASGAIMGLFGAMVVEAAGTWRRQRTPAARARVVWLATLVAIQTALDAATPQVSMAGHALGFVLGAGVAGLLGRPRRAPATAMPMPSPVPAARMPRRRMALMLGGATAALATALLFPQRRELAAAAAAREAAAEIGPAELAAIRALRFAFFAEIEAGAPAVNPERPFGSPDPLGDLARLTGVHGDAASRRMFARVMGRLPAFCARALLEPGTYPVDGAQVAVSAEQLRLLPHLAWETPEEDDDMQPEDGAWPVAHVDFARPYGRRSFFEADMAEALGLPVARGASGYAEVADELRARLRALHRTMAGVLRVAVVHGRWAQG